jgi:hypothetical protein
MAGTTRDSGAYYRMMEALKASATPGAIVDVAQVARQANTSRKTAAQAMCWALLKGGPIERVALGVYRYTSGAAQNGTAPPTSELFEKVAALDNGELLLRCEAGHLYIARRFETKL